MAFVPIYILILGFTIIIDYYSGIYIEKSTGRLRKLFLICSLTANIIILGVFKYYNFFNGLISEIMLSININNPFPYLSIILPIGLSFHTFQAMSYTIEVYRGNQKAETNFGIYALYVMFYPQLVAGPIERPQNILYQFYERHYISENNISVGLKLITWGLFKKIVVADRLALIVNNVYGNPTQFEGLPLIFATILFAFQIYCDFSGYSDIALGTARVIGFRLMKNFDRPYFSESMTEFWTRWHISLSTWFRDYLYIPLGGNRVSKPKWLSNLFITFFISGLWHGANWTFIIWGSINGLYLIVEAVTLKQRKYLFKFFNLNKYFLVKITKKVLVFSLICFSWIFFRAETTSDAFYIVSHLFSNISSSAIHLKASELGSTMYDYIVSFFVLSILLIAESIQGRISLEQLIKRQSFVIRMVIYSALILLIFIFGVFNAQEQFIYFQF